MVPLFDFEAARLSHFIHHIVHDALQALFIQDSLALVCDPQTLDDVSPNQ